ncbi:MAG: leucine-rich repeat domain-containing protein [Clostridia bacterium]|nr:leucine-rich repeat domain-containing protein [Clostridia bacterium]
MKKLLTLLLTLVLLTTAFVSCGNNGNPPSNAPEQSQPNSNGDSTTDGNETTDGEGTTDGNETTDGEDTTDGNSEATYSQGLYFELHNDNSSYYLSSVGTCKDSEVIIPAEYNNLPVTSIAAYAFENCTWITKVTIPESVTDISHNSFKNCPNAVETQDGVTYIGKWLLECDTNVANVAIRENTIGIAEWAFWGCNQITEVVIPDSVKYMNMVFRECSSLKSVTLPNGLTKIGRFDGCPALEFVTIPNSVKTIGDGAFYGCSSLSTITLPEGLTTIEDSAFYNCSSLVSISIPDSVVSLGHSAFSNCGSLKNVKLSNSLTTIESSLFSMCFALESIEIPESVTCIKDNAFNMCSNITNICLPDSVTGVGEGAFEYCNGLSSITMGNGITEFPSDLFSGCIKLKTIEFKGTKTEWENIVKDTTWNYDVSGCTVKCTDGDITIR